MNKEIKINLKDTVPASKFKETKVSINDTVPEASFRETKVDLKNTVPGEPSWGQTLSRAVQQGVVDSVKGIGGTIQAAGEYFWDRLITKNPISLPNLINKKATPEVGKVITTVGRSIVKTGATETQQLRKGLKSGSAKELTYNIVSGLAGSVPGMIATGGTGSTVPMLTQNAVNSFGNTYAQNRLAQKSAEKSMLSALGAGSVDVTLSKIQLKWLLNTNNSFVAESLRQGLGGGALDAIGESLKALVDKGTVNPEMTFQEAFNRIKTAGISGAITNTLQTSLLYPVVKAPRYRVNRPAEAAKSTLHAMGEKEVFQPTLDVPRPLNAGEIDNIVHGKTTMDDVLSEKENILTIPREEASSSQEIPKPDFPASEFYTNTVARTIELSQDAKEALIPENFRKTPETSKQWETEAKKNIDTDLQGSIERISQDDLGFSTGEESYESALIVKRLAEEADKTGDYSKLNDYSALHARKLGNSARALKAGDLAWEKTRDPASAVVKAQQEVQRATNKILEKDPNYKGKLPEQLTPKDIKFIAETTKAIQDKPEMSLEYRRGIYNIKKRITQSLLQGKPKSDRAFGLLLEYSNSNLLGSPTSIFWANPISNAIRIPYDLMKSYGYALAGGENSRQLFREANARVAGEWVALRDVLTYKDPEGKGIIDTLTDIAKDPKILDDYMAISGVSSERSIEKELGTYLPAISSDSLKDPDAPITIPWKALDYLGTTLRTTSVHALKLFDNYAEQVNYMGEARAEVSRIAHDSGLVGEQRVKYENQLWQDTLDYFNGQPQSLTEAQAKVVKDIHEKAVSYAKEATWKGDMPESLEKTSRYLNQTPALKLLAFRFFRTPINIMKWGLWDNAPLLNALAKKTRDDLNGVNGPEAMSKAWVNQACGAILWSSLIGFVSTHRVTGSHAPQERRDKIAAGIPEFSYDWSGNGDWVNYRRMEPLATPLSLIASAHELSHYMSNQEYNHYVSTMGLALANSIYSSTMLKQVGDLFRALDQGYRLEDKSVLEDYLTNQVNAYLPFSGLSRGSNRGAAGLLGKDPYMREVNDITEKIKETYAPNLLNPKLNTISGQPMKNDGEFIGMSIDHTEWSHPGIVRIAQLGMNISEPSKTIFGVKLDPKQYWEYRRYIDTKFDLVGKLDGLVEDSNFENIPLGSQKEAITSLISSIRSAAGMSFLMEKGLTDKIPDAQIKAVQDYFNPAPSSWNPDTEGEIDWIK